MRVFTTFLTLLALAVQSFAYQSSATAKKKASSKKTIRSKSMIAKSTSKNTSKTGTPKATASRAKTSKKPITPAYRRSSQQQPTVDRYKEIQQALASKGYFNGPIDGAWGTPSVDALKRFQHDQNLVEDGKIGSLSLLALGLGPKRMARAEPPPPPQ